MWYRKKNDYLWINVLKSGSVENVKTQMIEFIESNDP